MKLFNMIDLKNCYCRLKCIIFKIIKYIYKYFIYVICVYIYLNALKCVHIYICYLIAHYLLDLSN